MHNEEGETYKREVCMPKGGTIKANNKQDFLRVKKGEDAQSGIISNDHCFVFFLISFFIILFVLFVLSYFSFLNDVFGINYAYKCQSKF